MQEFISIGVLIALVVIIAYVRSPIAGGSDCHRECREITGRIRARRMHPKRTAIERRVECNEARLAS
jgi:hypothetical protein